MTLLELMLALVVVGILGVSVATMTAAASGAWTTRDHYRQQVSDARVIQHRIADLVRQGRRIITASDAGAARYGDLLLWADDDHFPGQVNYGELVVIRHDSQLKTLTLYRINLTDAQKDQLATNPVVDPLTPRTAANIAQFCSAATGYLLAEGVLSCKFTLGSGDPVAYRFVELRLTLAGTPEGQPLTQAVAAYVRAPDTAIDFGTGATP